MAILLHGCEGQRLIVLATGDVNTRAVETARMLGRECSAKQEHTSLISGRAGRSRILVLREQKNTNLPKLEAG